jgi:hypothetical protein
MTRLLFSIFIIVSTLSINAQVAKTTIVEHFTNSNCSVCASNNPTFYGILATQPNVLHIAFHPSSPYASCVFSQANMPQNDARTNYYGIYGGTPRFIVNGVIASLANMNTSLINAANEMSNFSVKTAQQLIGTDSVNVKIIIKKVASDTIISASIFVGAYQDTVNQTTGNGETIHPNVFRKGLSQVTGDVVNLPMSVNDSIELNYAYKIHSTWVATRMNTLAILQNPFTKSVIQSNQSINIDLQQPNSLTVFEKQIGLMYPNPAKTELNITDWNKFSEIVFLTLDGKFVMRKKIISSKVNIQALLEGAYFVQLRGANGNKIQQISIKK